jgi:RNA polymerase sigma-70 factor (ECF subfamily)
VEEAGRRDALEQLATIYWRPVYFYARRLGHGVEDAKDLTQAFLANLIEKGGLDMVEEERGRFRGFLKTSVKHFLANERVREAALKRGGGRKPLPLDFDAAETQFRVEPVEEEDPERLYQRKWARTLVDQALNALRAEFAARGRGPLFASLEPHLAGAENCEALAEQIGLSVSNTKITLHRARKRFGDLLSVIIRDTVASDAEVDDELRSMLEIL